MATPKTGSLISMILWSIVLIFGLSAVILGIILISIGDDPILSVLSSSVGILAFIFSLKKIIEGNNAWKEAAKNEILTEQDDILAVWKYPVQEWEQFVEVELKAKHKSSLTIAASTSALIFVGVLIGAFAEGDLDEDFWKIALPIAIGLGILVWYFSRMSVNNLMKVYLAHQKRQQAPAVIIGKKGIVISDQLLISFTPFGGRLTKARPVTKDTKHLLQFRIRMSNGNHSADHDYHVLIPSDHQEKAAQISAQIRQTYSLPN